jgi:hypothetical protein
MEPRDTNHLIPMEPRDTGTSDDSTVSNALTGVKAEGTARTTARGKWYPVT